MEKQDEKEINDLPDKILERIEKEHVKQIPGWWFKTKNILFWVLWTIFVVGGGSLAVSAMAFHTRFAGWDSYLVTHDSLLSFILDTFPYIWLIILVIFLIIGYENIKNTKTGYKYTFSLIAGVSLVSCLVGGFILYTTGLGQIADEDIGSRLPFSHSAMERQGEFWLKPNEGLLFGKIISIDTENSTFILRDKNKNEWTVDISELSEADKITIQSSTNIRLIGWREADSEIFNACFIIPWENEILNRHQEPFPDCDKDDCPLLNIMSDEEQKEITSCKGVPGYEFLIKTQEEEEIEE